MQMEMVLIIDMSYIFSEETKVIKEQSDVFCSPDLFSHFSYFVTRLSGTNKVSEVRKEGPDQCFRRWTGT